MATTSNNAAALTQIWTFQRLKGQENYQAWSKNMKSALKYCGLWRVVEEGSASFPDDLPEEQVTQETLQDGSIRNRVIAQRPTNAEVLAYQAKVDRWKELNDQAAELIYSRCDDKPKVAIEDVDLAMNRWLKLASDYVDSGFVLRYQTPGYMGDYPMLLPPYSMHRNVSCE